MVTTADEAAVLDCGVSDCCVALDFFESRGCLLPQSYPYAKYVKNCKKTSSTGHPNRNLILRILQYVTSHLGRHLLDAAEHPYMKNKEDRWLLRLARTRATAAAKGDGSGHRLARAWATTADTAVDAHLVDAVVTTVIHEFP